MRNLCLLAIVAIMLIGCGDKKGKASTPKRPGYNAPSTAVVPIFGSPRHRAVDEALDFASVSGAKSHDSNQHIN